MQHDILLLLISQGVVVLEDFLGALSDAHGHIGLSENDPVVDALQHNWENHLFEELNNLAA